MEDLTPVPGMEGVFTNEDGSRIVSFRRYRDGRVLTFTKGSRGHLKVKLGNRRYFVHDIVARTFIGPRPDGEAGRHIRHLDDDLTNNHWTNLAYGTPRENTADSIRSGRHVSVMHAAKTHCPAEHEYTPENTYVYRGRRFCKTCRSDRSRRWRESHR